MTNEERPLDPKRQTFLERATHPVEIFPSQAGFVARRLGIVGVGTTEKQALKDLYLKEIDNAHNPD